MFLLVIVKDGGSLGVVSLHALLKYFCVVIFALDQGFSSLIIDSCDFGWVELDVVGSPTGKVDSTPLNTLNKDIVIDLELNGLVDGSAFGLEHAI